MKFCTIHTNCSKVTPSVLAFEVAQVAKKLPADSGNARDMDLIPGLGKIPLSKIMATHSTVLTWKVPWTEEPCGLQSMESQRLRHDWTHTHMPSVLAWESLDADQNLVNPSPVPLSPYHSTSCSDVFLPQEKSSWPLTLFPFPAMALSSPNKQKSLKKWMRRTPSPLSSSSLCARLDAGVMLVKCFCCLN